MKNALSIDLEDWFCAYNLSRVIKREDWESCEQRIVVNARRLLELLAAHGTRATFFVLGWVAEVAPDLVADIEAQGHEIATHGYSHRLLTEMTPEAFETDLALALAVTRRCVKSKIWGFRAPSFSVTRKTMWAVEILARYGIRYDSSIFPIGFHPDYGMSEAELGVLTLGDGVLEFPMTVAEVGGLRLPVGGGFYFRFYPYAVTRWLMRRVNAAGRPAVCYLHPWEIDPHQPRVAIPWGKRFRHYYNVPRTYDKLTKLLKDFQFTTIRDILWPADRT